MEDGQVVDQVGLPFIPTDPLEHQLVYALIEITIMVFSRNRVKFPLITFMKQDSQAPSIADQMVEMEEI